MSKPIVFISHITEERDLAISLKGLIEDSFLGMMEVFVSSDDSSISAGARWLDNITSSLKSCSIELILCSPQSIKRPWINFEAGAGWIRDIPVIPLCHSGMEPSKLPIPLNLLQAAKISEVPSLKLIFPVLAQAIGAKTPSVDFTDFINNVKEFEMKYTFWNECNKSFKMLNEFNPQIINLLKTGQPIQIDLTETNIGHLESIIMGFLAKNNILQVRRLPMVSIGPNGQTSRCEIEQLSEFTNVISNKNLRF